MLLIILNPINSKLMKTQNRKKENEKLVKEVLFPQGVSASIADNVLTIKSNKDESRRILTRHNLNISIESGKIRFESSRSTKENKKIMGSMVAHVKNMVRGSQENHSYTLKICSGHFPMNVSISNNKFVVKNFLGEKVPRTLKLKVGADVKIDGVMIHVTSPSKELAGQVSADIEQLTRRPGFDTRVFQDGIYIINKDGRELK